MATSFAPDAKPEDWTEPRAMPGGDPMLTRAESLWMRFGTQHARSHEAGDRTVDCSTKTDATRMCCA